VYFYSVKIKLELQLQAFCCKGQRARVSGPQQINDVIPTLGQPMIAIWEYTFSIIDYQLKFIDVKRFFGKM